MQLCSHGPATSVPPPSHPLHGDNLMGLLGGLARGPGMQSHPRNSEDGWMKLGFELENRATPPEVTQGQRTGLPSAGGSTEGTLTLPAPTWLAGPSTLFCTLPRHLCHPGSLLQLLSGLCQACLNPSHPGLGRSRKPPAGLPPLPGHCPPELHLTPAPQN